MCMKIFADSDPTNNPVNEFFRNYGMWIAIAFASLILIALIILFCVAYSKRKKGSLNKDKKVEQKDLSAFISSLGGKENIISFANNGSRLNIELKNYDLVDENKLNEIGIASLIKMSNKIVLVIKDDMSKYLALLKD